MRVDFNILSEICSCSEPLVLTSFSLADISYFLKYKPIIILYAYIASNMTKRLCHPIIPAFLDSQEYKNIRI